MGILVMNIQSFSMPASAYLNPLAYSSSGDGISFLDLATHFLTHLFAERKFISIFSLLFGAGMAMLFERNVSLRRPKRAIHYRRAVWLLIFGLIHAYLFWYGDILTVYAICALLLYPLIKASPVTTCIAGIILFLIWPLINIFIAIIWPFIPLEAIQEIAQSWAPPLERIEAEIAAYRGGWIEQIQWRVVQTFQSQFTIMPLLISQTGGLMLIGMSLYRWKILGAERSSSFYFRIMLIGGIVGAALVLFGLRGHYLRGWEPGYGLLWGRNYNYLGSVGLALAYIAAIMLAARHKIFPRIQQALANYGRLAFTNYIGQTILASLIFYAPGLGLFGRINRPSQQLIAAAIIVSQIIVSNIWVKYFRCGPLEWLWRALTYQTKVPFRKYPALNGEHHTLDR